MKRFFILTVIILGAILFFTVKKDGPNTAPTAVVPVSETPIPTPQLPEFDLTNEWQSLSPGMDIKTLPYEYNGNSYGVQIVRIDPSLFSLKLHYDEEGKTIGEWAKGVTGLVTNAGFFKEDNKPVGLLYIGGDRIDDHRIRPAGTGLLMLEKSGARIVDLSAEDVPNEDVLVNALQAFPLLISKGKVVADSKLTKEDRRTAVGVDDQKNVYIITGEYSHLGLFSLAQLLKNSGIHFTEVLNLDGGGSTGVGIVTDHYKNVINSETLIPTVLVVSSKR